MLQQFYTLLNLKFMIYMIHIIKKNGLLFFLNNKFFLQRIMMKSSRQKDKKIDDNLIKDKKNLFKLKKK